MLSAPLAEAARRSEQSQGPPAGSRAANEAIFDRTGSAEAHRPKG